MAKSKIATAYVQIAPSADGIKGKLSSTLGNEMPSAGESAGNSFGSSLISKIKGMIAAAGIGKALSSALSAGADMQQSLGGIETLFKDSADTVIENAKRAYQTAGMSANDYMETVTGFSASLLQGLSGDTEKAASVADMALTDMSDNANKMGTDMELIQNAYQGFAKQNYTMLDNLKLGYGGTKTEMERLLADAQKLTGVEYDISNLSDVYEAIHVIQDEMGITGTTAIEAASTFSGSFASMKAAATDLLANLTLGEDIGPSLEALEDTVFTFVTGNLLPMVGNALRSLPEVIRGAFGMAIRGLNIAANNADSIVQMGIELVTGIGGAIITALPYLAEAALNIVTSLGSAIINTDWVQVGNDTINSLRNDLDIAAIEILGTDGNIVQSVVTAIQTNLPSVLESGVAIISEMANGMLQNLPFAVKSMGQILTDLLDLVLSSTPTILENGFTLIGNLATGLLENAPAVLSSISEVLSSLIFRIGDAMPELLEKGALLIGQLASGLLSELPTVISSAANILAEFLAKIWSYLPDLAESGISLIGELAAGLIRAIPQVKAALPQIFASIANAFDKFNWKELGLNIIIGIANGIRNGGSAIIDAAKQAARSALNAAKKALGIHSPSTVMRDEVGKFIPAGIAEGISGNQKTLTSAMCDLSDLATSSIQNELKFDTTRTVVAAPAKTYGDVSFTFTVYGAQGQNVDELAEILMQKIQFAITQREAALT